MKIVKKADIKEIEQELRKLGGGNHDDNMKALNKFPNHYLVELSESDFLEVVFLQSKEVSLICPSGQNRRLKAVAERAKLSTRRKPSENWDLDQIMELTGKLLRSPKADMGPIFLRDAQGSECQYGRWYLQDGSHRALGYAIALITKETTYSPIQAYCATQKTLPLK